MTVRVRFFAMLRERAGRSDDTCELPDGAAVSDLWDALAGRLPQLAPLAATIRFAVNQEYVDRTHQLHDNDEVALIPPVSGG